MRLSLETLSPLWLSLLSAFIWYETFSSAIIMNLYIPSIVMTEYIELSE